MSLVSRPTAEPEAGRTIGFGRQTVDICIVSGIAAS